MIQLDVVLDSTLVQGFRDGRWRTVEAHWADFCRANSVEDLRRFADVFPHDLEPSRDELALLHQTVEFVESNLQRSVEHIASWLPDVDEDISHRLKVVLLPYGKFSFGPHVGLQLFSLERYASPIEAFLFLVHVYYHELSFLNETPHGSRCSRKQVSADDFKEWIRLLIRNEGIGNYAVLGDLMQLREAEPDYTWRYFTYARKIGDPVLLHGAISVLTKALTAVDDRNVDQFRVGINRIFKNEALPIINLVGIHMAETIASYYDTATLKNVYQQESADFFALYGQTDGPFASTLKDL
jgi:hypothetical protein